MEIYNTQKHVCLKVATDVRNDPNVNVLSLRLWPDVMLFSPVGLFSEGYLFQELQRQGVALPALQGKRLLPL